MPSAFLQEPQKWGARLPSVGEFRSSLGNETGGLPIDVDHTTSFFLIKGIFVNSTESGPFSLSIRASVGFTINIGDYSYLSDLSGETCETGIFGHFFQEMCSSYTIPLSRHGYCWYPKVS